MIVMSSTQTNTPAGASLESERERLADLERRSLLAEQARQQAHKMRTPLSVIKLVAETLQLELVEDRAHRERLQRLLGAAATLSDGLSDSVRSTRFGDGPPQRLDAAALGAGVIRVHGGRVVPLAEDVGVVVEVERDSLEAALVHCLRLIGIGTDCIGARDHRPLLECRVVAGRLVLRLRAEGGRAAEVPVERADLRLMAQAAERAARDSGGTLHLAEDTATLELPLAPSPA